MCGIICVVSRQSGRPLPIAADIVRALVQAIAAGDRAAIAEFAKIVAEPDYPLRGVLGLWRCVKKVPSGTHRSTPFTVDRVMSLSVL